jgi:hypothetical protein
MGGVMYVSLTDAVIDGWDDKYMYMRRGRALSDDLNNLISVSFCLLFILD